MAALAEKKSFAPLLPVGFHQTDLAGLSRLCVEYFPGSSTRPTLMNTATTIVSLINRASIPARLWVGGNLLTEEPNPTDFTLNLVLVESVFRALTLDQREFFDWFRTESLYERYHCDNYGMIIDADRTDYELIQTYWLRQSHSNHGRHNEGVAEILVPTLSRS